MKRNKLAALLGAGLLTFGITGVALADTLNSSFVGKISDINAGSAEDCAAEFPDLQAGQWGLQFNLGGADQNDGTLDAAFSNPSATVHQDHAGASGGGVLKWFVVVNGDDNTTLDSASTDATANAAGTDHLVVSHVCFGGAVESQPPSEQPSEQPSQGGGGDTNQPTQPSTDALGTSGQSGPSDTAWLLVVALGVLLASVVVLTPARSKSRR